MSAQESNRLKRRRFMTLAVAGVVAAPLAARFGIRAAHAKDKPKLDPESERATELSYTHDASSADSDAREVDARCANCTHFKGDVGMQWAQCNIFPEHVVNADGWCSSWFSSS